ncbi:RNA export factor gle2 [Dimargaris xerosporica]|nr:RNA export factor gle2 [Dimargaris xerosporica]
MDSVQQLLVAATAERHVCIYDLSNPTTPFQTIQSPLKWQTRVISCLVDASGYMLGSIEGRVAIQYIQTKDQGNNFTFRCHRDRNNIYAVNDMSVHPTYGTFSTAGSDGLIHIWDKGSKQRLKSFDNVGGTVPCTAFNRNGSIFAYAVSYDWSKGHQNIPAGNPCKIFLHPVQDEDAKPRPAKKR